MLREKIIVEIKEDTEAGVVDVSIMVLGVDVWLACFDTEEQARSFIKVMFDELNKTARFVCSYEIL